MSDRPQFWAYVAASQSSDLDPVSGKPLFGVAWHIMGPDGMLEPREVEWVAGSEDRAMVTTTVTHCFARLPAGAVLHIVSGRSSYWMAFHPDHRRLQKWEAKGFRKAPPKNREQWGEVARVIREMRLEVTADEPKSGDHEVMKALLRTARGLPPLPPPTDPRDGGGDPWAKDDAEWLRLRAMDKDK
jgi:hypothetical protein